MDPKRSIFPVLELGADFSVKRLLGTCFAVGPTPALVTAAHVVRDNPLSGDDRYGIVFLEDDGEPKLAHLDKPILSPKHDVAVFSGGGIPGARPLNLLNREAGTNEEILTYEFSSTRFEMTPEGKRLIAFEPFTHRGNILIHYPHGASGTHESTPCFDVSFPALQGASGAPVILQSLSAKVNFTVVGMLVANVERHLLPAQVVHIEYGEDEKETTSYFLPFGRGISVGVLREFLESVQADPGIVG